MERENINIECWIGYWTIAWRCERTPKKVKGSNEKRRVRRGLGFAENLIKGVSIPTGYRQREEEKR